MIIVYHQLLYPIMHASMHLHASERACVHARVCVCARVLHANMCAQLVYACMRVHVLECALVCAAVCVHQACKSCNSVNPGQPSLTLAPCSATTVSFHNPHNLATWLWECRQALAG